MKIEIREEREQDREAVRRINEEAFETSDEANIVDKLQDACDSLLSLVATENELAVGHILFSPVTITGPQEPLVGMGLAPMAVLPERQGQGIGTLLVQEGLRRLRESGTPFVIVVGHPDYYLRFGFQPASRYGIRCQWDGVPDPAFMILVFDEPALRGVSGVARYRKEFDEAM